MYALHLQIATRDACVNLDLECSTNSLVNDSDISINESYQWFEPEELQQDLLSLLVYFFN